MRLKLTELKNKKALKNNSEHSDELTKEQWHTLIVFARWWSKKNIRKFAQWDIDDIISEVIVGFFYVKHRYDPDRGSMNTFLKAHIWDPVFRSYARQFGIIVSRPGQKRGGPTVKRIYTTITQALPDKYDIEQEEEDEIDLEVPLLPEGYEDIIELLKQGFNQKQISFILGVTEGRISQRMRQLRKELNDLT